MRYTMMPFDSVIQTIEPRTRYSNIVLPFLTGGAVGMTSCTLLYPLSFCTTRISVDVGDSKIVKREFLSLSDCARKIYKSDGFRGFYQGMSLSCVGVFLYRSTYFGIYTVGKRAYLNGNWSDSAFQIEKAPFFVSLMFAQLASIVATFIAYPLDTMSRQKMLWSGRGSKNYVPIRQVVSTIRRKDGLLGFYKGVFTNLLTTLCGSLLLVSYDLLLDCYQKYRYSKVRDLHRRA
ncbi:ADP/ATP translocase 2 [Calliopsis andreniformis]|uniref:ADP/ATP translocase 2 n=1 Tax=Calliopsis andreniformis TaxID=337506 RepID=UPI003FCDE9AB